MMEEPRGRAVHHACNVNEKWKRAVVLRPVGWSKRPMNSIRAETIRLNCGEPVRMMAWDVGDPDGRDD